MESVNEIKNLGKKVIKYTLMTTIIAATVALSLFLTINPVSPDVQALPLEQAQNQPGYFAYLMKAIPSNVVQPFSENNVIGVLILAMLLSIATLSLPTKTARRCISFFRACMLL